MPEFVTDTHSLLWYFTRPQRLGSRAAAAFSQVVSGAANLIVPIIVLAELMLIAEHKPASADFDRILGVLQVSPNIIIADLTATRLAAMRVLTAIADLHDRAIVAEAQARRAILITRDRVITASGLAEVVW